MEDRIKVRCQRKHKGRKIRWGGKGVRYICKTQKGYFWQNPQLVGCLISNGAKMFIFAAIMVAPISDKYYGHEIRMDC